ncbi:MAG: DUF6273 domain-containing protein [Clostridia bacterium]|nr:DUF6273 domain-containing protein [Clostridia bacterium]
MFKRNTLCAAGTPQSGYIMYLLCKMLEKSALKSEMITKIGHDIYIPVCYNLSTKKVIRIKRRTKIALILFIFIIELPVIACANVYIKAGDTILMGSYPQTRLESVSGLTEGVDYRTAKYYYMGKPADSYLDLEDSMIVCEEERAYKLEPISFRVISVVGDKVTAVSDKIIEAGAYNSDYESVAWKDSSMSAFLKGEFKASAFSARERSFITDVRVVTKDEFNNLVFPKTAAVTEFMETKSGNFAYALKEFQYTTVSDYTTGATTTTKYKINNDIWWLSSDASSKMASFVNRDGTLCDEGTFVDATFVGVRPVVEFAMSDVASVASDGTLTFREIETLEPITVLGNNVYLHPDADYTGTKLVAALFKDEVMVDVKIADIDTSAGVEIKLLNFYNFMGADGVVKLFWFENFTSLRPLCQNITVDNSDDRIDEIVSESVNGYLTINGKIDFSSFDANTTSVQADPWNPIEVTLQMYDSRGNLVYIDQTTATLSGEYNFGCDLSQYKGQSLSVEINNTYNSHGGNYVQQID